MNIDSISFNVWSSKLEIWDVDLAKTSKGIHDLCDFDERYATQINIEFVSRKWTNAGDRAEDYCEEKLGFLYGIYFDMEGIVADGEDIFKILNANNKDMADFYRIALEGDWINLKGDRKNLFYIDLFYIKPEYRNQGIGGKIVAMLKAILKHSLNLEPGCLIATPAPLELENGCYKFIVNSEKKDVLAKKLNGFFKKQYFKEIPNEPYLYNTVEFVNKN